MSNPIVHVIRWLRLTKDEREVWRVLRECERAGVPVGMASSVMPETEALIRKGYLQQRRNGTWETRTP